MEERTALGLALRKKVATQPLAQLMEDGRHSQNGGHATRSAEVAPRHDQDNATHPLQHSEERHAQEMQRRVTHVILTHAQVSVEMHIQSSAIFTHLLC